MPRLGFAIAPTVLVCVLVACSSEDEKSAARIASEEAAVVLCDRLFACCSPTELGQLPFVDDQLPPTYEGCVDLHKRTALEYIGVTDGEVAAGRVALHLDRTSACVQTVRAETCTQFHARLRRLHLGDAYALCNADVVEPLVADEGACKLYLDCRSGSCVGAKASADGLGKCKALPTDGQPCAVDGCATGLRCDPDEGKCTPLRGQGAECLADDACESGACRDGRCVSPGRCGG